MATMQKASGHRASCARPQCTAFGSVRPVRSTVSVKAAATAEAPAKKMPIWPQQYQFLMNKKLRSIPVEEASELVESGKWALVDVRLPEAYTTGHPKGAVSAPMYRTIDLQGANATQMFKTLVYRFNGINPVEMNPDFEKQVKAAAEGKTGIILCCEAGGTLRATMNFPEGKASRSLQACFRCINEDLVGGAQVAHLERGIYGWFQADLDIDGEFSPDIGRTPMAAADPTLSRVAQENGYEMREGDKPTEKPKNWWGF